MQDSSQTSPAATAVPVLPLRDVVVYPHMVIPLFVGRDKSIHALDAAMRENKQILLVAQKDSELDEPEADDLYRVGTLSNVLQLLKLPDGTVKVLMEGHRRCAIRALRPVSDYLEADIDLLHDEVKVGEQELEVLMRTAIATFDQYVKLNKRIPPEVLNSLAGIDDPGRLADTIAAHMTLKVEDKQTVLEIGDVAERLEKLMTFMEGEVDILEMEKRIRGRVKQQMEKNQREYYLNEQMKAIQKELGEMEDVPNELEELQKKIEAAGMPAEARKKADAELHKLKLMSPMSAEATVVRNYIDWMVGVPWKKRNKVSHDLEKAQVVLDSEHYGLEKVKERILEYLAVQQRVKAMKGPILCLVGPPGVGKTSLGQSIAHATGRKYARMALGGVRDEAEIRGHRRTYIGALPGRILQIMKKAGVVNPVVVIDEIDKLSADFRGDPASALLEVFDAEQNYEFSDHYLEVPYDLSQALFICTANLAEPIPATLKDRMQMIQLPGYTRREKYEIARQFLIPKQMKENGVERCGLKIPDGALYAIIDSYTREAGVRNLEREIASVIRNRAVLISQDKECKSEIADKDLLEILGPKRFEIASGMDIHIPGVATGLAWTEFGGDTLIIESCKMPRSSEDEDGLKYTGHLGAVMQESVRVAWNCACKYLGGQGADLSFLEKMAVHLHCPEGAVPKDGPSAGMAMTLAFVSLLSGRPVRRDLAVTGEVALRDGGTILPVGGIKEKLLAAHRASYKHAFIPLQNQKDLPEVPEDVKREMEIHLAEKTKEVIEFALQQEA
jgi:ATP-dependent Lon protease